MRGKKLMAHICRYSYTKLIFSIMPVTWVLSKQKSHIHGMKNEMKEKEIKMKEDIHTFFKAANWGSSSKIPTINSTSKLRIWTKNWKETINFETPLCFVGFSLFSPIFLVKICFFFLFFNPSFCFHSGFSPFDLTISQKKNFPFFLFRPLWIQTNSIFLRLFDFFSTFNLCLLFWSPLDLILNGDGKPILYV